jgi:hypothetical protein
MPARSVDQINITNFVDTGLTTPFARYTFTLVIKWTDTGGVKHVHGPQTYTFPNDLAGMPLIVRRAFAVQMITAMARVTLGIDAWEQYQ